MTPKKFIPVSQPALVGKEREYVLDCIDSSWISSTGKYIEAFEESFASFCGTDHAVTCTNGTVALHLALDAFEVKPGDEVLVPDLTFVATANAVAYCGAKPVLVDIDPNTWNIDPTKIEASITEHTKGIVVVHLLGNPADMEAICSIARANNLFVIEDAAEAHGASIKQKTVGSWGDAATFSFYGNKIITTGEGGMVVCNNPDLAARMRQLRGQGMDPQKRYWHPILGYNYRMTNIAAAIGLAQLEKIDWHLAKRREVADFYKSTLAPIPGIQLQIEPVQFHNVYWSFGAVLPVRDATQRDNVMARMKGDSVDSRPFFFPMHSLPMYSEADGKYPVAHDLAARGILLPSYADLQTSDLTTVCESLSNALESVRD